MPLEVRVPATGESVSEATVGAWLKREGDVVQAGEALVELETDKVNLEVAADRSGVLERIERREGDTVRPGDVLAILADAPGAAGGQAAPSGARFAPEATGTPPDRVPIEAAGDDGQPMAPSAPAPLDVSSAGPPAAPAPDHQPREAQPPDDLPVPDPQSDRPHASPLASRIAQEHGIDLAQVSGSGTAGRVTREDVERYLASAAEVQQAADGGPALDSAPTSPAPQSTAVPGRPSGPSPQPREGQSQSDVPAPNPREERVRLSRRRQTIAQRLLEATQTTAMLTTFNEVDMTAVMEIRARRRESFRQRHGVGLGFMSFFTRAVVGGLKAYPRLNAEIQGNEMVLKKYYDIGIAVAADEGLVVPVVRDADRKGFAEIEREIAALAERARANSLTLDDLRGGTFTITNGGVFGSLLSTPILSPPQVGILGMHTIQQRPVARDGQVVIRPMMYLALSYDHRLVDGAEAVQFLVRVKELVEDPESLLLEG